MVNEFNGTAWGKWTNSSWRRQFGSPAAPATGAGKVICAATATNGNLQVTIFNGSAWSTPTKVARRTLLRPQLRRTHGWTSALRCAKLQWRSGMVRLQRHFLEQIRQPCDFCRLRSELYHRQCERRDLRRLHDRKRHHGESFQRRQVGWFPQPRWRRPPANPTASSLNSGGQITCFAEAYNSGIYVDLFNGHAWTVSDWSSYSSLGGQTVNNASCTSQIADELVCGVDRRSGQRLLREHLQRNLVGLDQDRRNRPRHAFLRASRHRASRMRGHGY